MLFVGCGVGDELLSCHPARRQILVAGLGDEAGDVGQVDLGVELGAHGRADAEQLDGLVGLGDDLGVRRRDDAIVVPLHPRTGSGRQLASVHRLDLAPADLDVRRLLDRAAERVGDELTAEADAEHRGAALVRRRGWRSTSSWIQLSISCFAVSDRTEPIGTIRSYSAKSGNGA